jgi:diketogulonate reductase-like aldo/keto reductase
MSIPTKRLESGFEMPIYGLGTWKVGGDLEADYSSDEASIAAIKTAIEHGVKHIDTAEMYGDGHAEELVGKAIAEVGCKRDEIFITTKVSPTHLHHDAVLTACENSLKRLGLDYVDLYLMHFPPPQDVDIHDTMRALDELVDRGLVKNIGVSNFTPHRFDQAQAAAKHKLVCNQVNYSLMVREIEKYNLVEHAKANDYFIAAWRPLQLSYEPGVGSYPPIVDEMAAKYSKTPNQIAINWLVSQTNTIVISKTMKQTHLEENLGALNWTMEEADIEKLRNNYPPEYFLTPRYELDKIPSSMPAK